MSNAISMEPAELIVQVDVNRQQLDETVVVMTRGTAFYFSAADLARWNIVTAGLEDQLSAANGDKYFNLAGTKNARIEFDPVRQKIDVNLDGSLFESTRINSQAREIQPRVTPTGTGFVDYQLFRSQASGQGATSALYKLGWSGSLGALTSSWRASSGDTSAKFLRMDTTWQFDVPEKRESWRVGDALTRRAAWSSSARIGGIQYATNFATQPGLAITPLQTMTGVAALPSTVSVYVNNALRSTTQVAPGPFSVDDIAMTSGGGEIRVVVRDALGREQVLTRPYYLAPTLLQQGLHDFSYEVGRQRQGYGLVSSSYGAPLASATHRYGLTNKLTLDFHAQGTADARVAGTGLVTTPFDIGSLALALARDGAGHHRSTVQYEWTSTYFNAGLLSQADHGDFMLPTDTPGLARTAATRMVHAGASSASWGSLSVAVSDLRFSDQTRSTTLTLGYTRNVGQAGFLNITLTRPMSPAGATTAFATLTLPLDAAHTASYAVTRQGGKLEGLAQLQKNPQGDEDYNYVVSASSNSSYNGYLNKNFSFASVGTGFNTSDGQTSQYLTASGSLVVLGGQVFATRSLADGFGLARVADIPDVKVLVDNHEVGRTDRNGYAFLPRLRPYEDNAVSIDQQDLPVNASIGKLSLVGIPSYKGGVVMEFPVRRTHPATFRLRLDDGAPVPAGAMIHDARDQRALYPVGDDGEAYAEDFPESGTFVARWKRSSCTFEATRAGRRQGADPVADLGSIRCVERRAP